MATASPWSTVLRIARGSTELPPDASRERGDPARLRAVAPDGRPAVADDSRAVTAAWAAFWVGLAAGLVAAHFAPSINTLVARVLA